MMKFHCDRCGEEIKGIAAKMLPAGGKKLSMGELHELLQMKAPLQDKVFCKGCIEEIVNFALNKNICDECVQQMMDENAMLRAMDGTSFIGYIVPAEEVAKAMRSMLEDSRVTQGGSEQYIIPLQPVDPELIRKYKALQ